MMCFGFPVATRHAWIWICLLVPLYTPASCLSSSTMFMSNPITLPVLQRLASSVRTKLPRSQRPPPLPSDHSSLYHPSNYVKTCARFSPEGSSSGDQHLRGFCNWLVPGSLMVGQYPSLTPETDGPSQKEVQDHIRSIVADAGVRTFCCLQSEVPAQDDDDAWHRVDGAVLLEGSARSTWPGAFTWYAPLVRAAFEEAGVFNDDVDCEDATYLHTPIDDLTVPDSGDDFYSLLYRLLRIMEANAGRSDGAIYVHCWAGRGRAGLVGSCILSLLYPEMNGRMILDLVQAGYDSRDGSEFMPDALSQSPETSEQRDFVLSFASKTRG